MKNKRKQSKEESLLDAIDNFKNLSKMQQNNLKPLLEKTIERYKDMARYGEITYKFFSDLEKILQYTKKQLELSRELNKRNNF